MLAALLALLVAGAWAEDFTYPLKAADGSEAHWTLTAPGRVGVGTHYPWAEWLAGGGSRCTSDQAFAAAVGHKAPPGCSALMCVNVVSRAEVEKGTWGWSSIQEFFEKDRAKVGFRLVDTVGKRTHRGYHNYVAQKLSPRGSVYYAYVVDAVSHLLMITYEAGGKGGGESCAAAYKGDFIKLANSLIPKASVAPAPAEPKAPAKKG